MTFRELGPLVALLTVVPGCTGDGEASLNAPGTLAVGAYAPLAIGDQCAGGKLDFCSNEGVTDISASSVRNPRVLEVLRTDALPPELSDLLTATLPWAQRVVRGVGVGQTEVCLSAHFDDGDDRRACRTVTVSVPDDLVIVPSCQNALVPSESTGTLVPPGTTVNFGVELWAKGKALGGNVPDPLENTEVMRVGPASFTWASPIGGGSVNLVSAHVPGETEVLATVEPSAVDEVVAEIQALPPFVRYPGQTLDLRVRGAIGGTALCDDFPTSARSETPDICLGPEGEATWSGTGSDLEFSAVASGTCRLSLGVTGGSGFVSAFEAPLVVLDPAEKEREANANDECPTRGMTTCANFRYYELVCRAQGTRNVWQLGERCDDGAICTFMAPASECTGDCTECR